MIDLENQLEGNNKTIVADSNEKQSNEQQKEKCAWLISHNCPLDNPTRYAGLGYRIGLTFISCLVLGCNSQDGQGFFSGLLLFYISMAFDYAKFIPNTGIRKNLKRAGLTTSVIFIAVGFLGLSGMLEIAQVGTETFLRATNKFFILKGFNMYLSNLLYMTFLSVILTGLDWAVYDGFLVRYLDNEEAAS